MPLLIFVEISLLAGFKGIAEVISACINLKAAKKVNKKATGLLGNIPSEGVVQAAFELGPMMPVLKKGALTGVGAGILAAFGAYGVAGILAIAGRSYASRFGGNVEKFTMLAILGDGSPGVEAAVLAGVAAGTLAAVLGAHARKKAEADRERAYVNLFRAKRAIRESHWKKTPSTVGGQGN